MCQGNRKVVEGFYCLKGMVLILTRLIKIDPVLAGGDTSQNKRDQKVRWGKKPTLLVFDKNQLCDSPSCLKGNRMISTKSYDWNSFYPKGDRWYLIPTFRSRRRPRRRKNASFYCKFLYWNTIYVFLTHFPATRTLRGANFFQYLLLCDSPSCLPLAWHPPSEVIYLFSIL